MKITYTLYPLRSKTRPAQPTEGYWNIDTNQIALSWRLFSDFNKLEKIEEKKSFLTHLKQVSKIELPQYAPE
jgi:hypothetical protein